ncbi:hypothetical protein [Guggenheimella bovis]
MNSKRIVKGLFILFLFLVFSLQSTLLPEIAVLKHHSNVSDHPAVQATLLVGLLYFSSSVWLFVKVQYQENTRDWKLLNLFGFFLSILYESVMLLVLVHLDYKIFPVLLMLFSYHLGAFAFLYASLRYEERFYANRR